MRLFTFLLLIAGIFIISCHKDHSLEDGKKNNGLPADYPFQTGLCDGVFLGFPIADSLLFEPDTTLPIPAKLMLDMPTPGDQGGQKSCAAWAVVYGLGNYYVHTKFGHPYSDTGNLSPKFTYNQITKGNCTCTGLKDNLYLLTTMGAPSLKSMPYDDNECAKQPDSSQKQKARDIAGARFASVLIKSTSTVKHSIVTQHPIVFGIGVEESFQKNDSPYIWKVRTGTSGNAHALVVVGYDDGKHAFRIMNSWSTGWADNGFVWIDYDLFQKIVGDTGYVLL
jgi:cathepsin K